MTERFDRQTHGRWERATVFCAVIAVILVAIPTVAFADSDSNAGDVKLVGDDGTVKLENGLKETAVGLGDGLNDTTEDVLADRAKQTPRSSAKQPAERVAKPESRHLGTVSSAKSVQTLAQRVLHAVPNSEYFVDIRDSAVVRRSADDLILLQKQAEAKGVTLKINARGREAIGLLRVRSKIDSLRSELSKAASGEPVRVGFRYQDLAGIKAFGNELMDLHVEAARRGIAVRWQANKGEGQREVAQAIAAAAQSANVPRRMADMRASRILRDLDKQVHTEPPPHKSLGIRLWNMDLVKALGRRRGELNSLRDAADANGIKTWFKPGARLRPEHHSEAAKLIGRPQKKSSWSLSRAKAAIGRRLGGGWLGGRRAAQPAH